MNVLAIMGSPKKKGNTYKVTRKVEEQMKQLGDVEFEYVFLKDLDLKTCRGCQICFDKGEELCPLKDDRSMLEEKMQKADGVIFTSPNYVFNVSGLMKNFMDRFGYVCHRPRFFKNAMALTTSGVGGSRLSLMSLKTPTQIWGFNVVSSLGVVTNGDPKSDLSTPVEKVNKRVKKAARKFYNSLSTEKPKPGFLIWHHFYMRNKTLKKSIKNLLIIITGKIMAGLMRMRVITTIQKLISLKEFSARLLSKSMGLIPI